MRRAAAAILATAALALPASAAAQRPNVVVIQTDDQNSSELYATAQQPAGTPLAEMPNTLGLLAGGGVTFNRYYVSDPLCCPSRATLLTGQYAHNDGVLGNGPGPFGGYAALDKQANLAVWLQGAGYRTIHVGKFLNFYGQPPISDPTEVPPGWSNWQTLVGEDSTHYYYGYRLNVNGTVEGPLGDITYTDRDPADYQTDVLTERAVDEIDAAAGKGPFYLELDYTAPHGDLQSPWGPEPAPRYYDSFSTAPLPRPPGFNEADVSDKPRFIRNLPRLGPVQIADAQQEWQKEVESLRSVDDGVARVIAALDASGQLADTYVLFTSDNGFFQGEHRIRRSKFLPYEPSARVPLLIRGPGIPAGSRSAQLVANVDVAPTILGLAGASPSVPEDGVSLMPFARHPARRTRRPILLEGFTRAVDTAAARGASASSLEAPIRDYAGIRVGRYKYVRYAGGPQELYDLRLDRYELHSRASDPRYRAARAFLAKRLRQLRHCRGAACSRRLRARIPGPSRR